MGQKCYVLPEKLATGAEAFPGRGDADTHASYRRGGFATHIKLSFESFARIPT